MGENSTHIAIFPLLRVQTILAKSVETNIKLLSKLCKNNTDMPQTPRPPVQCCKIARTGNVAAIVTTLNRGRGGGRHITVLSFFYGILISVSTLLARIV